MFKQIFSFLLCVVLTISLIPGAVVAADTSGGNGSFVSETHDVFQHTESTLVPGVEQYTNYAYAKDGKQMVYYVATADISRDDVVVQTSYLKQHENGVMGMDKLTNQIASLSHVECKPFQKTHDEQLKLVTSFDCIPFNRLEGVEQEMRQIFEQAGDYMDEARISAILDAFSSRREKLRQFAEKTSLKER